MTISDPTIPIMAAIRNIIFKVPGSKIKVTGYGGARPHPTLFRLAAEFDENPPFAEKVTAAYNALGQPATEIDIRRWQTGIKRSINRMTLLLCGDVMSAGRVIREQSEDDLIDLVDFALSKEFWQARQSLGIAVKNP